MRDAFHRASLAQDRQQDAAGEQETDDAQPKSGRQSQKARQQVTADLGNKPIAAVEMHVDPDRFAGQRPVDGTMRLAERPRPDKRDNVSRLLGAEALADSLLDFAHMGDFGGIDGGFRRHAIAQARPRDRSEQVLALRLPKARPEMYDGGDLVGHQAGGAADTLPVQFDKGGCEPEHLDEQGDGGDPEEGSPQSSARDRHDPSSTGKVKIADVADGLDFHLRESRPR